MNPEIEALQTVVSNHAATNLALGSEVDSMKGTIERQKREIAVLEYRVNVNQKEYEERRNTIHAQEDEIDALKKIAAKIPKLEAEVRAKDVAISVIHDQLIDTRESLAASLAELKNIRNDHKEVCQVCQKSKSTHSQDFKFTAMECCGRVVCSKCIMMAAPNSTVVKCPLCRRQSQARVAFRF